MCVSLNGIGGFSVLLRKVMDVLQGKTHVTDGIRRRFIGGCPHCRHPHQVPFIGPAYTAAVPMLKCCKFSLDSAMQTFYSQCLEPIQEKFPTRDIRAAKKSTRASSGCSQAWPSKLWLF